MRGSNETFNASDKMRPAVRARKVRPPLLARAHTRTATAGCGRRSLKNPERTHTAATLGCAAGGGEFINADRAPAEPLSKRASCARSPLKIPLFGFYVCTRAGGASARVSAIQAGAFCPTSCSCPSPLPSVSLASGALYRVCSVIRWARKVLKLGFPTCLLLKRQK